MSDIPVSIDRFGRTIEELLARVGKEVESGMPGAVEKALAKGEDAWKRNAKAVLSISYSRGGWGKERGRETYKSGKRKGQLKAIRWYGRTYKTGRYANSIRHRMTQSGGSNTVGEIGSASMPGLAHLLEKGHAAIGGGTVPAYEHIAPAADEAFADFERLVDEAVEEAINEA